MKIKDFLKHLPIFTRTSWKAFFWTSFSVIALLILFLFLSSPTYDNLISINSVELTVPYPDTHIFLNTNRVAITTKPNEVVTVNKIPNGLHTIIAAKNDYGTWARVFDFNFQNEYTATPFLIEKNPERDQLMKTSSEYKEIINKLPQNITNTSSIDGNTEAWAEGNKLFFGWTSEQNPPKEIFCTTGICTDHILIQNHTSEIRNISFYKNRNDVVLFEADDTIYVVGADGQTRQTFYKGTSPHMYKESEETIYIQDQDNLYKFDI